MSESVRYVNTFTSDLGDALFRGNDFHSRELRSIVGELQVLVRTNNLQSNLNGLSQVLGSFLPARIRDNPVNDYWYQRDLENWNSVQKPTILAALETYFIDGGKENDAKDISACINLIEKHGITIECKDKLMNELSSGEWRSKLAQMAMQGRVLGIRFHSANPDLQNLSDELKRLHGFDDKQVMWVCGNVVRTK